MKKDQRTMYLFDNEEFVDTYKEVKSFYQSNFVDKKDVSKSALIGLQNVLKNSNIQDKIRYLSKRVRTVHYELTTPFTRSLIKNINDYVNMEASTLIENRRRKRKSLVYSFESFISSIEAVASFQKYIACTSSTKKSVLAISLINKDADDILANEEIEKIRELSEKDENLFVFPVQGCSFEVFITLLKLWNFDVIHLSGHGLRAGLHFVNSSIGYTRFVNTITPLQKHANLYFLNCCITYEYVKEKTVPFSDHTICYKGTLDIDLAYNTSICFYTHYLDNRDVTSVWKQVEKEMKDIADYHFLSA